MYKKCFRGKFIFGSGGTKNVITAEWRIYVRVNI